MGTLLSLLALVFFVLMIIGFFSPKTSLFWLKGERTRVKSFFLNGGLWIACLVGIVITVPKDELAKKGSAEASSPSREVNNDANNAVQGVTADVGVQYKKIGDQIEVGNFSYVVNSVKFSKAVGNDFSEKKADGIFLIVNLTFRNNDKEEHTLDNSFFKLTDESNTEFESSTEGETALEMSGQETLFLKQCNPRITKSGLLIFEVPEKKEYNLHLSGGFWNGQTAVVKLVAN